MLNRAYKTYGNVIELEYATISSKSLNLPSLK